MADGGLMDNRILAVAIETTVEVFADGTPFGDDRTMVMLRRET